MSRLPNGLYSFWETCPTTPATTNSPLLGLQIPTSGTFAAIEKPQQSSFVYVSPNGRIKPTALSPAAPMTLAQAITRYTPGPYFPMTPSTHPRLVQAQSAPQSRSEPHPLPPCYLPSALYASSDSAPPSYGFVVAQSVSIQPPAFNTEPHAVENRQLWSDRHEEGRAQLAWQYPGRLIPC